MYLHKDLLAAYQPDRMLGNFKLRTLMPYTNLTVDV